jgi:hypothetical protein
VNAGNSKPTSFADGHPDGSTPAPPTSGSPCRPALHALAHHKQSHGRGPRAQAV